MKYEKVNNFKPPKAKMPLNKLFPIGSKVKITIDAYSGDMSIGKIVKVINYFKQNLVCCDTEDNHYKSYGGLTFWPNQIELIE